MSRAAKMTLAVSVVASAATVWGVHYMQVQEREVMHKGVERDIARLDEKKRQRALDLESNKAREEEFQKVQPTKGWLGRLTEGKNTGPPQTQKTIAPER